MVWVVAGRTSRRALPARSGPVRPCRIRLMAGQPQPCDYLRGEPVNVRRCTSFNHHHLAAAMAASVFFRGYFRKSPVPRRTNGPPLVESSSVTEKDAADRI